MTTPATDALAADIKAAKPVLGTIEFADETFDIVRKPSTLLLAELARTGSGDPEAVGVIAEFFEVTLGKDTYRDFKRAFYGADIENDAEVLMGFVAEVMEKTLGRPTK